MFLQALKKNVITSVQKGRERGSEERRERGREKGWGNESFKCEVSWEIHKSYFRVLIIYKPKDIKASRQ